MSDPRLIVALDYSEPRRVRELVARLSPAHCRLKVGKELFTRTGPVLVEELVQAGFAVFLDLKFHDIPNTVARACAAAADLGVWMVNVHALGGRRMMEAAHEALQRVSRPPLLIAVTVLTSLEDEDLAQIGWPGGVQALVLRLAVLAQGAGLDGVVCSPQEVGALRQLVGSELILVTPGVRPDAAPRADQRRTMTPGEAIRAGSDYLVLGRPITQADDPLRTILTIESDIAGAT